MTPLRPLRILMIVEASFAGVGRHALDLAGELTAMGHQVDLAYGTRRAEPGFLARLVDSGLRHAIPIDAPRQPGLDDVRVLASLRKAVAAYGPYDIVHGHSSKGGAYARLLRSRGARVVYTPNALITQSPTLSRMQRMIYSVMERVLARRTDVLICVSQAEAAHAHELHLRPGSQVVVPNGIPLVELPSPVEARQALGLAPDGRYIGFVGRLDSQKGLDVLIAALPQVLAKVPDAQLVVIGEGELRAELEQQAIESGVDASIRWLGRQPGQSAMRAFDVFALPSRYEGFPYVALEALWAGIPAVVTEQAGCHDLLSDDEAGRIVPREAGPLAEALIEILGNEELQRQMSSAATSTITAYSVASMAQRTLDAYSMSGHTMKAESLV